VPWRLGLKVFSPPRAWEDARVAASSGRDSRVGGAATMRDAMSEHTERLQKLRERVLAAKEFL